MSKSVEGTTEGYFVLEFSEGTVLLRRGIFRYTDVDVFMLYTLPPVSRRIGVNVHLKVRRTLDIGVRFRSVRESPVAFRLN